MPSELILLEGVIAKFVSDYSFKKGKGKVTAVQKGNFVKRGVGLFPQ